MSAMGKIALVTGAGTGVGKAAAHALLADGWTVIFAGRRVEKLHEAISEAGGSRRAQAFACDVTDEAQVAALFTHIEADHGRLDLLFNNAGSFHPPTTIDEMPVETWRSIVDVNLTGSFLCARVAFGLMRRQEPQGGRIINNGSISAYTPRPGSVGYTATKHAMTGLTKTLALDGRPFNIACGQIDIGNAATDITDAFAAGVRQANGDTMPEPVFEAVHVGQSVLHMANLPLDTNVLFMTVMATTMPYVGRG